MFIIVFGILKLFVFGEKGKGALQVTSYPLSKVYINNAFIGNTPLCRCEANTMLQSGDYTIRIVPIDKNLNEFGEKITITKGVLTVVDRKFGKGATSEGSIISLVPLANKKSTELLVISLPDKSEIFVDSNNKGATPLSIKNLTDSDHALRLRHAGYQDKNIRIRTPAGYKLVATVYLGIKDAQNTSITPTPIASPSANPTGAISPSPTPKITGKITPSPTKKAGKVTILQTPNGFLRVRQSPSISAPEVSRVNTGESFPILDEQNNWYKITTADNITGWISGQFASKD
jgi:hypothetical protein